MNSPRFQFTHPGKGATIWDLIQIIAKVSFNSRTLERVRHFLALLLWALYTRFNSRTLERVRLSVARNFADVFQFQFTHPGKGVTPKVTTVAYKVRSFNSRTLERVRPASSLAGA